MARRITILLALENKLEALRGDDRSKEGTELLSSVHQSHRGLRSRTAIKSLILQLSGAAGKGRMEDDTDRMFM